MFSTQFHYRRTLRLRVLQISTVLSLLCTGCNEQSINTPARTVQPKHVVLIGVDAMSPNGIINAQTPNLDTMMKNGAYTLNARGVLPTSSSSNWASMVSGAGPEQHGVTSNSWERDDRTLPPVLTGSEDIFPTIFSLARKQRPELEIGAIYTWQGFGRLIERSALSHDLSPETDEATVQAVRDYLISKKPNFLFIHLDNVDHVGHHDGHKTPAYYQAVSGADRMIGDIIQATKDAGTFEQTVFIVTADHGGIGYGHGGETMDEIEIPFIVYGKNVKQGHLIKHKIYTYDTAATLAFLLGIEQHLAWIGRAVTSAFTGFAEPDIGEQKTLIAAPVIHPPVSLYAAAGGLYVDTDAQVTIKSAINEAQIRYTTDGSEPTSNSTLYEGPFTLTDSAVVKAKAFLGDNQQSNSAVGFFRLVKSNSNNGINYSYYEGDDWHFLPAFLTLKAKATGRTYQFRVDKLNQRNDYFGLRFVSYLQIDSAGQYKFYLNSDDGSKLYINDQQVVDNDGAHGTIERAGTIELKPGLHKITVDYFNEEGGIWLDAFYKGPGISKQIIPADKLFLSP